MKNNIKVALTIFIVFAFIPTLMIASYFYSMQNSKPLKTDFCASSCKTIGAEKVKYISEELNVYCVCQKGNSRVLIPVFIIEGTKPNFTKQELELLIWKK